MNCHGTMQTIYEAVGGREGLLRLAGAWHSRVLEDEVVGHAFGHVITANHFSRRIDSRFLLPRASHCLNQMLPKRGGTLGPDAAGRTGGACGRKSWGDGDRTSALSTWSARRVHRQQDANLPRAHTVESWWCVFSLGNILR